MIRVIVPHRLAGLALGLLVVSATGGCAHFHNAEVRAQERAGVQRAQAPVAEAEAPPASPAPPELPPAPPAQPAATPAPEPVPTPGVADQATPAPPVTAAMPAEPSGTVASRAADAPHEPARETPVAPTPTAPPEAMNVPPPPTTPATAPAPATDTAIIIFANVPVAACGTCETLKISVAPSGQVLMERGSWTAGHHDWHYKRSRADIGADRAAAFAASLSADRPLGAQMLGNAGCAPPATGDDGLSIEWIEADRHDRLTVKFGCSDSRQAAERLRHAPDLLGLRQLDFP